MTDERDEIRARVDIVDLVSRRVALKRSGKNYSGLCPFHEDRNPSFVVDPRTGRYRCWSCGESGDIFTWVMKTEHVEFVDALKELAEMAGVKLSKDRPPGAANERDTHRRAMAEAQAFFTEQLGRSEAAQEYCRRRILDSAALATWELGFSPEGGDGLAIRLKKVGISLAEGKSLFLVEQDSSGGFYDRFKGRLMFPIRDERGELVAFGGRVLGDGMPKYINSSDTPLYRKSHVLYGMVKARDAMAKAKRAVLVEGYLDVIACHRSGIDTAVASLGTALSEDHAKLLKRWVQDVVVLYDSDEAGQKAAERAIGVLQSEGLRVRIALMPKGEDPDTLLRLQGPEAVKTAAERGVSPVTFRLAQLEKRLDPNQEQFWTEAVAILATTSQDLEVERHVVRLAAMYPGTKDVAAAIGRLKNMIDQVRGPQPRRRAPRPNAAAPEYKPLQENLTSAEVALIGALYEPDFRTAAWMTLVRLPEILTTAAAARIASSLAIAFPDAPPQGEPIMWLPHIEPEEVRQLVSDIPNDFRAAALSEKLVADSIRALKTAAERRNIRLLKSGDLSKEQSKEGMERLKELNPDPRNAAPNGDDDPFS